MTDQQAAIDRRYPSAAQSAPVAVLGIRALADLQRWTAATLPDQLTAPLPIIAFCEAMVHPWARADQLRLPGRMAVWVCALDDHLERDITELDELDQFIDRCNTIVRTGRRDEGNPLLASLSGWQRELAGSPNYPALAELWVDKFATCLRAMRYDWVVGAARANGTGSTSTVEEYLANADSISVWQVHLPRWTSSCGPELADHLDVLVPALDDIAVVGRLANDLASFARERLDPRENNVLMYDVSPGWVRAEIDRRLDGVRRRLAGLVAQDHRPAIGLQRLAEWIDGIYAGNDPRISSS
jgi:hypothetical protein